MANVCDYLRWRGDLTFEERPFNDVDNLVLSILSYLDLSGIVPTEDQGGAITLRAACKDLVVRSGGDVVPFVRSLAKITNELVQALYESARFGNVMLSAYADVVDNERAVQFSALTADIDHAGRFVAFRGTDNTIVGWREDFMLSFTVTEAQREAARYLERAVRGCDGPVFVGGHSKGGMLAEYATMQCPGELLPRIGRVYSNDGPGMAPEVVKNADNSELRGIMRRIVPSYSVVGMLFSRAEDTRVVVRSTGKGIEQHDPTTWQVARAGFEERGDLKPECVVLNVAIANWAGKLSLRERATVTKQIFDALEAGGATTINEIASSPERLQSVLHALGSMDERTKDVTASLLQSAMDSSVSAIRIAAKRALARLRPTH